MNIKKSRKLIEQYTIIMISILGCAAFWLIDSIFVEHIFDLSSFPTQSFLPPIYEISMRLIAIACILAIGITGQVLYSHMQKYQEKLKIQNDNLEKLVADRSDMLLKTNKLLHMDIEAKESVEASLRKSEERWHQIFDNMSSGVAIYEAIDNGNDFIIRDFNKASEKIEKIKREDVIGKRVKDCFPGIVEFGLIGIFQKVWNTGLAISHPIKKYRDNRISGWRENYVCKLPSGEIAAIYDDVTQNMRAKEELRIAYEELRNKNITLNEILNQIEFERDALKHQIAANMDKIATPIIEILKERTDPSEKNFISLLDSAVRDVTSPFTYKLKSSYDNLAPREIEICNMIKNGFETKDIARSFNTSPETVKRQRKIIRRKLNLTGRKINLSSYLQKI